MSTQTSSQQISAEVGSWPGVQSGYGKRGEFAFKLEGREIGHLHGDHAAHFLLSPELWIKLQEQGRITEHPVFPGRVGPAERRIDSNADTEDVIAMMRIKYDQLVARQASGPHARRLKHAA